MYFINYLLKKTSKYRSSIDAPRVDGLDEVLLLLDDLSIEEQDDEIGIYCEVDTSQTTIELVGEDVYLIEIFSSARYLKELDRKGLEFILRNFSDVRADPQKYDFDVERIF